jgi:hypothetical protein
MAHFARLDENNVVKHVIVVDNKKLIDPETGEESESLGIAFCQKLFGGNWIQTSYNDKFRKRYAAVGSYYDPALDAFILPKPFETWIMNTETAEWESPIGPAPELTEENIKTFSYYKWDESLHYSDNTKGWVLITPEIIV